LAGFSLEDPMGFFVIFIFWGVLVLLCWDSWSWMFLVVCSVCVSSHYSCKPCLS
jgi:hypothetical protein